MRRAFTLIEAIAAIAIIALATPPTFMLLADVSDARRNTIVSERALWLSAGVLEHVVADVHSGATGLGVDALDDLPTYLDDATNGLRARIANLTSHYEAQGLTWDLTVSDPVSASGAPTGDADEDVFREITVTVTWSRRASGDATFMLARLVMIQ